MQAERMRILEMLEQGKVTAEQANRLLEALEQSHQAEAPPGPEPGQPQPGAPEAPPNPWAAFSQVFGGQAPGMNLGRFQRKLAGAQRKLDRALGGLGRIAGPGGRANYAGFRLTRANLSRMQQGTKYANYGNLAIADDVPEDLLADKIGEYINYGSTTGPANLVAVLEDRCTQNFGRFEEGGGPAQPRRENRGTFTLRLDNLSRMEDGTVYVNRGNLRIADDVPEELLEAKIAEYTNRGDTRGPAHLIAVLEDRCTENHGDFVASDQPPQDRDEG